VDDLIDDAVLLLQRMSPVMAQSGHPEASAVCPLSGVNRKTFARSELFRF
jgi:hypothetical protein